MGCFDTLGEHIRLKVCLTSVAFRLKAHKKNHSSVISKLDTVFYFSVCGAIMILARDREDPLVFVRLAQYFDVAAEPVHRVAQTWSGCGGCLRWVFTWLLLPLLTSTRDFVI